jgi:hypothetical protein
MERLLWLWLLHSTWLGLLAAGIVAVSFQVFRRLSHGARHRVLVWALGISALGPGIAAVIQDRSGGSAIVAVLDSDSLSFVDGSTSRAGSPELPLVGQSTRLLGPIARPGIVTSLISDAIENVRGVQPVAIATWLCGVAALSSIVMMGALGLRRRWQSSIAASVEIEQLATRIARSMGLPRMPQVRICPGTGEPCLCGISRPVIFLPEPWLAWSRAEHLEAILAHELAHARRGDVSINAVQRLVEIALFFHPAVHWMSRSMRRHREFCADALAVGVTGNALALAEALESVARLRFGSGARGTRLGTALGGESGLVLTRIQELLGMKRIRGRVCVWPLAALPVGLLCLVVAAGAGKERRDGPSSVDGPFGASIENVESGNKIDTDRQISFELRRLEVPAESWRNRFESRLKLVSDEDDTSAWLLDRKRVHELLDLVQADSRAVVWQAPKVTTFEFAPAFINSAHTTAYVSRVEVLESGRGFRPIVKYVDDGWKVKVSGAFLEDGTRVSSDVRDSTLLGFTELHRTMLIDEREIKGTYQVPNKIDRHSVTACDIPDGSSLIVSLGLRFNTDVGKQIANAGRRLVGLGGVDVHSSNPNELLLIITPTKIVLGANGQFRVSGQSPKTPSEKGAVR